MRAALSSMPCLLASHMLSDNLQDVVIFIANGGQTAEDCIRFEWATCTSLAQTQWQHRWKRPRSKCQSTVYTVYRLKELSRLGWSCLDLAGNGVCDQREPASAQHSCMVQHLAVTLKASKFYCLGAGVLDASGKPTVWQVRRCSTSAWNIESPIAADDAHAGLKLYALVQPFSAWCQEQAGLGSVTV